MRIVKLLTFSKKDKNTKTEQMADGQLLTCHVIALAYFTAKDGKSLHSYSNSTPTVKAMFCVHKTLSEIYENGSTVYKNN